MMAPLTRLIAMMMTMAALSAMHGADARHIATRQAVQDSPADSIFAVEVAQLGIFEPTVNTARPPQHKMFVQGAGNAASIMQCVHMKKDTCTRFQELLHGDEYQSLLRRMLRDEVTTAEQLRRARELISKGIEDSNAQCSTRAPRELVAG